MIAAWYDRQGPAADVLHLGELPTPEPGPGEVRVKVAVSSVNPGDTKKRLGWLGSSMAFPRVVPHSDGAGVVDAVGAAVSGSRVGERVWVFGAQSYRPFGTAAQFTVLPEWQAVALPDNVSDEVGGSLGIPGITAHRAVFAEGDVDGRTVMVHGILGGVGSLAAQLARWGGATVIGTVRRSTDIAAASDSGVEHVVALDDSGAAERVRDLSHGGVDHIVDVAFSDNVDFDAAVAKNDTVIAAYGTRNERPDFPFWPMLFDNITIRLLGSDDFSRETKVKAATDLTTAARDGALSVSVDTPLPLTRVADAHERVDAGTRKRVVLQIPA